jgi:AAA domain/LAGLIDADG-like domain
VVSEGLREGGRLMQLVPKGGRPMGGGKAAPTPGRMTLSNVVRGRLSAKPFRVLLHAIDGVGKAQPKDRGVLTPRGFVPIGSLKAGDEVCSPDGNTQLVLDVYPRGVLPVFRVETSDGGATLACGEHLWTTTDERGETGTYTTEQVASTLVRPRDKWPVRRHRLPALRPVQFATAGELPLDPYLLGLLLGDGNITGFTCTFHKPEPDLWEAMRALVPAGDEVRERKCVNGSAFVSIARRGNCMAVTRERLEALGLWGTTCLEKFVPEAYLTASPEDRIRLLRGLVDTDGSVRSNGTSVEFSTSAPRLASAVVFLVRSLGGTVVETVRDPKYPYKGETRTGAPSHRLSIWFADDTVPVASKKNLAKWKRAKRAPTYRTIRSVEPAGEADCVCIRVSNEAGLYITDDFIVTHNSTWAAGAPNPIFICSEEGTAHLDVARFPTPRTWPDVIEAVRVLTEEEHDFKTLVIDTLDWLEPMCWAHVCSLGGKKNIEDFGFGKGFVAALDYWRALYARLDALVKAKSMHTILIAHSAIKRVDDPHTGPFDRYRIKLHDRASDLAREWVDAVLFARHEVFTVEKNGKMRGKSNGARVMHTRWSAAFDAKNRFDLPETLPLDWEEFETAARAGEPRAPDALRREIDELLPRLASGVRAKADEALARAGRDPQRLARVLDRVRANVGLAEEGAGEDGEPAPAREGAPPMPDDEPEQAPPSERPPANEADPWGLNNKAAPDPSPPPPPVAPRPASAPPPARPSPTPVAPAVAVTSQARPEAPPVDPVTAKLRAHLEGARLHLPDHLEVKGRQKTRAEFHGGLLAWAGHDAGKLHEAIEGLWKQVPKADFDRHVEALAAKIEGGPDVLKGLRAEKSTRGRIVLALEGHRAPPAPLQSPAPAPSPPADPDDPEAVAESYVADARAATSEGDLDEMAAALRDDPRVGGELRARAEAAIKARRVTLVPITVGNGRGNES